MCGGSKKIIRPIEDKIKLSEINLETRLVWNYLELIENSVAPKHLWSSKKIVI